MTENLDLLMVFLAGLGSVFSPCVIPIIPVLVAGTEREHRARPLFIVAGLSVTFVLMGIVSSLLGAVLGPIMSSIEKAAGIIIIMFGIMLLFDLNIFKKLIFLNRIKISSNGNLGGLFLGLTLGIIWIPCVGPMLSSVLALVAAKGSTGYGVFFLLIYSLGFAIPILVAAYAAHFFRNQTSFFKKYPVVIRLASAVLLITFGLFIIFKGMLAFSAM